MTQNLPNTFAPNQPVVPEHFSRDQQGVFVETLSHWGNVTAAARAAGVSRTTAYRMRRACPNFERLWDGALLLALPQVEAVLADRALNGVEETVYYHGEEVATRVRYDPRLLLAHLGRLDRLKGNRHAADAAVCFDTMVAQLVSADEVEVLSVEEVGEDVGGEVGGDVGGEAVPE